MDEELKDRSGGLVFAGIVEILVGVVLLLFIPLALYGGSLSATTDARTTGVSVCSYLVLATFFVWTGVATLHRRRWARTLMHSVAGLWLIVGIAAFVFWLAISPIVDGLVTTGPDTAVTSGVVTLVKLFVSLVLLVVYVALPGALLLFLRSPSVRATVERHDPTTPWTDRVTARLLSMILTLVYLGATGLLLAPFGGAPFFGILLGPLASAAVYVLVAALCGWLAYGFYRGDPRACWGTIALAAVGTASAVWTFLRVDPTELWLAFGIREEQLELLRASWIASASAMIWMAVLSGASVAGYALYVRRDLRRGRNSTIDSSAASQARSTK